MEASTINSISPKTQMRNPMLQAILIIIVVVLFGWFIVIPKNAQVSQKSQQLEVLETQAQNLEADLETVNRLVAQLESSDSEVKLVDEALPLTNRPTRIALLLEEYARSSGMQVAQINIENVDANIASGNKEVLAKPYESNRSLITTNVTVSVGGSIDQFKNILT